MAEGIGEPYFDMIFRRLLEEHGINYLPPGTVRSVDYVLSRDMIFVELEDTTDEIYGAITQLLSSVIPVAELYNAYVVIAIPTPRDPASLMGPLQRFYIRTWERRIKRELWIISAVKKHIIKIIQYGVNPSPVLQEVSHVIEVFVKDNGVIPDQELIKVAHKIRKLIRKQ